MAKAIGAIHKKNGKLAASLIKQMGPELKTATSLLSKAQKQLVTIGGKNIFAA
jgi:predicted outer membrane protein